MHLSLTEPPASVASSLFDWNVKQMYYSQSGFIFGDHLRSHRWGSLYVGPQSDAYLSLAPCPNIVVNTHACNMRGYPRNTWIIIWGGPMISHWLYLWVFSLALRKGRRFLNIHHTRIRLGCCKLKSDIVLWKYDPFFTCDRVVEDYHYLFIFPRYNNQTCALKLLNQGSHISCGINIFINQVLMIMLNYSTMFKHLCNKRLNLIEYIYVVRTCNTYALHCNRTASMKP